ncbi:uncharacterized protein [Dermacentor albipictus]|uniref:uncharacterized protein n=1 Tax=Dermacentor albipictus TaxID=60249 RepID=UPI0038FCF802
MINYRSLLQRALRELDQLRRMPHETTRSRIQGQKADVLYLAKEKEKLFRHRGYGAVAGKPKFVAMKMRIRDTLVRDPAAASWRFYNRPFCPRRANNFAESPVAYKSLSFLEPEPQPTSFLTSGVHYCGNYGRNTCPIPLQTG